MSGRQGRSTRQSQRVEVLSDVSGNVPAETRRSTRKSAPIVKDVPKTVLKRPAEKVKSDLPKKRDRKSAPAGGSTGKTSIANSIIDNNSCDKVQTIQPKKRGRKSAAMVADVQQMANQKQSDEQKIISPKKRGQKNATVVNGQHVTNGKQSVGMIADSEEQITPNQAKKRGPKSPRAPASTIQNESLTRATLSIHRENELREIIMRKYFHISERLRINTSAKCLRNLINCSKTHKKNRIMLNDDSGHIEMYLNNNEPFAFLNWIKLHLLEGLMPKTNVMQLVFELILGINHKKDNEYAVEAVLEMAVQTFSNILITFPPCWLSTLPEYRRLISVPCKNRLFISQEFDTTKSLFENITNNLESLIHPRNGTLSIEDQNKKNMNDSLDISFSTWETKNKQKYSYDELTRDEKVERTFYALEMMIHLFEVDLQMWTARHSLDPQSAIFDQSKHPLINSVLWDSSEHNQINFTIKSILKLFVNYVSIDFPKEHTNILSRLVNVAYNILELNELITDNVTGEIEYPLANRNGNNFCDTLTNIIYENPNYSVNLWLKVVEYVIHPKLKLHLISSFFTKIQSREIILNPKKIYAQLRQLEIQSDAHSPNDNNNEMPNEKRGQKETNQSLKYPFIQKVQRRATSEISYDQEVELCLIALNSYVEVRHIKDVRRHLMDDESHHVSEAKIKSERQELMKLRQDADLKIQVKSTQKSGSFSSRLKSITENNRIYDMNVTNAEAGLYVPLKIDLAAYRDDIKFVDLVSPHMMPKLGAKFSHLFATLN